MQNVTIFFQACATTLGMGNDNALRDELRKKLHDMSSPLHTITFCLSELLNPESPLDETRLHTFYERMNASAQDLRARIEEMRVQLKSGAET